MEDFQFLAECDVLVASDDNDSHERAPLELNKELEAWAIIDSGAEVSIMSKEIFEKINVPELKAPLDVYAFKGSKATLDQVKKIPMKTTNKQGIFKYYCFDFKDLERIILSRKTLQELGMVISGVPATFPSGRKEALKEKLEQSKVFRGLNKEKENLHDEVQHPKELANKLLKELKEDLEINAALGDKAYCNIPGSDFIVKIKEGQGPVYKCQYPIQQSLIGKVKERVAEWETNRWVEPVKGMKNAWNNLLVAMPKVSGGRTDENDIRLCVDACPGNSAVMGPKYNLPKITEMFS